MFVYRWNIQLRSLFSGLEMAHLPLPPLLLSLLCCCSSTAGRSCRNLCLAGPCLLALQLPPKALSLGLCILVLICFGGGLPIRAVSSQCLQDDVKCQVTVYLHLRCSSDQSCCLLGSAGNKIKVTCCQLVLTSEH